MFVVWGYVESAVRNLKCSAKGLQVWIRPETGPVAGARRGLTPGCIRGLKKRLVADSEGVRVELLLIVAGTIGIAPSFC